MTYISLWHDKPEDVAKCIVYPGLLILGTTLIVLKHRRSAKS